MNAAAISYATPELPKWPLQNIVLTGFARNFRSNHHRTNWMIVTPSGVGNVTIQIQQSFDIAEMEITGKIGRGSIRSLPEETWTQISKRALELYRDHLKDLVKDPARLQKVINFAIEDGTKPVMILIEERSTARWGFEAILASSVMLAWTAYETMAGDLWESAINAHPEILSDLNGTRNRFIKRHDKKSNPLEPEDGDEDQDNNNLKQVKLDRLIWLDYDLRGKLGTALRYKFGFNRLSGISAGHKTMKDIPKRNGESRAIHARPKPTDQSASVQNDRW